MTVTVLTAIYDNYDLLHPFPPQDVLVEAICITDNPHLHAEGWTIRHRPSEQHPNLAAKHPKCCPWQHTNNPSVIWIDGSFAVTSSAFVREALEYGPVAQFTHPDRDCIYTEAAYSATLTKYADLPLTDQAAHYRAAGHPDRWGLWATGVIVRSHSSAVEQFGIDWLAECERWGYQDQISEAPMLNRHSLYPNPFPGTHLNNRWLRYDGSARH